MAFGKNDTDGLYDNHILPVLRRNGITPVIINRCQSNQDLNLQIIEQILKCDFSIVDLTYARPSVYYEAGFAEREVSVIYTVRKDHLSRNQSDDLRVHFDLQMKPLIEWSDINDKTFSTRLEKRLKATVLKKWAQQKKELDNLRAAEEKFSSLYQSQRLSLLRRRAMAGLKSQSFIKWKSPHHPNIVYRYKDIRQGIVNDIYSSKYLSEQYHYVSIHSFPSATKSVLLDLRERYSDRKIIWGIDREKMSNIDSVYINRIVISIRVVPKSRIEDVYPNKRKLSGGYIFESIGSYPIVRDPTKRSIPLHSSWHFLSGIKSELHLDELLVKHIDEYMRNQTA